MEVKQIKTMWFGDPKNKCDTQLIILTPYTW